MMFSRDEIIAAARAKGHTEEEIRRLMGKISDLKRAGLVKTSGRGASVGLTNAGLRKLLEHRASGEIPRC